MPGHENWTIVSFPDHYYHLLLPKAVTDTDSAYYKGKHGAEITGARKITRPDTWPSVADGWAGAEMRVFPLFDSIITDGPTDGRTDRRTDKASYRVACPQLKSKRGNFCFVSNK